MPFLRPLFDGPPSSRGKKQEGADLYSFFKSRSSGTKKGFYRKRNIFCKGTLHYFGFLFVHFWPPFPVETVLKRVSGKSLYWIMEAAFSTVPFSP